MLLLIFAIKSTNTVDLKVLQLERICLKSSFLIFFFLVKNKQNKAVNPPKSGGLWLICVKASFPTFKPENALYISELSNSTDKRQWGKHLCPLPAV